MQAVRTDDDQVQIKKNRLVAMGKAVSHCFQRAPNMTFLNGILGHEPPEKKERKPRETSAKSTKVRMNMLFDS